MAADVADHLHGCEYAFCSIGVDGQGLLYVGSGPGVELGGLVEECANSARGDTG
jgi:hypothetical protein